MAICQSFIFFFFSNLSSTNYTIVTKLSIKTRLKFLHFGKTTEKATSNRNSSLFHSSRIEEILFASSTSSLSWNSLKKTLEVTTKLVRSIERVVQKGNLVFDIPPSACINARFNRLGIISLRWNPPSCTRSPGEITFKNYTWAPFCTLTTILASRRKAIASIETGCTAPTSGWVTSIDLIDCENSTRWKISYKGGRIKSRAGEMSIHFNFKTTSLSIIK